MSLYSQIIQSISGIPFHNEILWIIMALLNFGTILLIYRYFGKSGLYAWIPVSIILANIQVQKLVVLGGSVTTLGNILYATSFLVTDILSENYGKKASSKAVVIGFITLLFTTGISQFTLIFPPFEFDQAQAPLEFIFGFLPRIAAGSLIAYMISQAHDVWIYHWYKSKDASSKMIWLRNNASTMVSQLIDTVVFCTIAFLGTTESWSDFWSILITTYVIKVLVAGMDTPLVYLARSWKEKGIIAQD